MTAPITVGSSDVASILGLDPWNEPAKTWARLTGIIPRYSAVDSNAQRRGRVLEAALLDEWARMRSPTRRQPGPRIDQPPIVVDEWRACRPDMVADVAEGTLVVEAKTTRRWDLWGADGSGDVPVHYAAQVAWQLSVLDLERAELVAFCPMDDDIRVYSLTRNRAVEALIIGRVRAWMEAHVWCAEPEPPGPLPWEVVSARFGEGGEAATWVDPIPEDLALARELAKARAEREAIEAREDALKASLCARIGDAYGLKGVCTWGRQKGRETVDAASLKSGWPEVYAQVARRGSSSRQFRLTLKEK